MQNIQSHLSCRKIIIWSLYQLCEIWKDLCIIQKRKSYRSIWNCNLVFNYSHRMIITVHNYVSDELIYNHMQHEYGMGLSHWKPHIYQLNRNISVSHKLIHKFNIMYIYGRNEMEQKYLSLYFRKLYATQRTQLRL